MQTKMDWLSFTLPVSVEPAIAEDTYHIASAVLYQKFGELYVRIFDGSGFHMTHGRAPFRYCAERTDHGVRIYAGSNTSTILVEMTGRGCEDFKDIKDAKSFIAPIADHVTRIDLATDIECAVDPEEFADARSVQRFKSVSTVRSGTGVTCYVGSRKSDRYARVYRYADPHPRAAFLRVECVFRRDLAKSAALALLSATSWHELAMRSATSYGWNHAVWSSSEVAHAVIASVENTQSEAGTVLWMYRQVAPAVRRLVRSGAFDLTEWLMFVQEVDEREVRT